MLDHLTATGSPTAEIVTPAKMDAALKAKWVEALRSGKFEQATGGIGDVKTKRLCCLGVGAVICRPDAQHFSTTDDAVEILESHGLPGFGDPRSYSEIVQSLINMNDKFGKSFSEIADYIEENL